MNTTVEGYQLAPQQKRLWQLVHNMHNTSSRARCMILLKGNLDVPALHIALQSVIARHEILRTTFRTIPGMNIPLQVIDDAATAWSDYADMPHVEDQFLGQNFETVLPYIEQQTSEQNVSGPAAARLYTLSQTIHVLFLDMPGLWLDHQGIECIASELARCYQADDKSEPEGPVQYADVAQWLNELLDSQEGAEGRAYWHDRLITERPHVPFSRTTSAIELFNPQHLRTTIAPTIVERVAAFTNGSDASLQAFLLSCLNLLVWHLSGREDVVIGTAYDGRTEGELRDVPGFLTRYIPVLTHLEPGNTYVGVWQQVMKATQEAEELQDYFDWSDAAKIDRKETTVDYFPICFELHKESSEYSASDVTFTVIDSLVYNDLFDLRLSCTHTERGLIADFYYNVAALDHADIERLTAYFSKLVEEAATSIEANIESLDILGDDERHTLLCDFARGKQEELHNGCLAHKFEEQVKCTPHNIALALKGRELTYTELNAQANRLAHQLKRLGVRPGTMVALCTERSLEAIIGLLGILKAGGVYVPLDPAYPQDRLTFILKDSRATVVVTQEKLSNMFSEYNLEVVSFDIADAPEGEYENPLSEVKPEHLAYVIYTSGSTGQPKGVEVSHQVALSHFVTMQHEFNLSEQDRVLQFASLSFDVSLEQILPTLFCGAAVVMRGPTLWSVAELSKAIVEQGITVVNLTPAFWQQWSQAMLTEPDSVRGNRLRLVIVGGEVVTLEALRSWRMTPLATLRLLNAYGPTEAVITATIFDIPEQFRADNEINTVPIGRPLANREVYILDKNRKPTARGIPGELYLGGELLAKGYLNQPDLTADHFVLNPFNSSTGARLYRTGDLGHYLPDGTIEYLGRVDQQVKIRGFRIEPGEIEAALQKHPDVQTAIVVAREDDSGEKHLVAYVLCQQQQLSAKLRSFLIGKLPEYMIPSAFMCLDTLPLTVNGKVDRRALPAPSTARPELEEVFTSPRNAVEEMLASIWREVLPVDQVGIHDNFFKLGGHSLTATQVIARVRTSFQVDLPVHVFFQEPTIARLADKITEAKDASNGLAMPPITRLHRDSGVGNFAQPER